jgi:hypothetical protein
MMVTVILSYWVLLIEVEVVDFWLVAELQLQLVEVLLDYLKIQQQLLIGMATDLAIVQDLELLHSNSVVEHTFVAKAFPRTVNVPTFEDAAVPFLIMLHCQHLVA